MGMMTSREALMQILRSEGVEYIFGLPGSSELLFMDVLEDHPEIKYILGLHECVAAGMAAGYSRASGKVGVVNLHTWPGLGAAMPILLNSRSEGIPLIVTAGRNDTYTQMQDIGSAGNLVGLGNHFAKWSTEVIYAEDLALAIRRAFKVATQPPTGPVFISLPQNVLNENLDFEYQVNPPLSLSRRCSDRETIDSAAELLGIAQTPYFLIGSGIAKMDALLEVTKLAELTGARVYHQTSMTDVNFPTNHPQYMGDTVGLNLGELFRSADVLVAIGTPLFSMTPTPSNPTITTGTEVIQIDSDPWEIAKNFPVAAGIDGDIKLSIAELIDALQKKMSTEARQAANVRAKEIAKQTDQMKETFRQKAQTEKDNIPISISRLMQELAGSLKPGTVLVDESWTCSATLRRSIYFTDPTSYYRGRGQCIGWGMPASIGIKLALPDRPVVAVIGDGSAIWSFQSLWTAASHNIPITYVICSNTSYRTVKTNKIRKMGEQIKGRYLGLDFASPTIDFCQLAQGLGVHGQKVNRPEDLKEALKSVLESEKPALVDIAVEGPV
ncbi:thiamine pyrophosphate-binding protein [Chloroflexota bacterium]